MLHAPFFFLATQFVHKNMPNQTTTRQIQSNAITHQCMVQLYVLLLCRPSNSHPRVLDWFNDGSFCLIWCGVALLTASLFETCSPVGQLCSSLVLDDTLFAASLLSLLLDILKLYPYLIVLSTCSAICSIPLDTGHKDRTLHHYYICVKSL